MNSDTLYQSYLTLDETDRDRFYQLLCERYPEDIDPLFPTWFTRYALVGDSVKVEVLKHPPKVD